MRAAVLHAAHDVRVDEVPTPTLLSGPGSGKDAVVRVVAACVCGSDLWPYRGVRPVRDPARIGHEMVGVVEAVGADVRRVAVGDFVIAPFYVCCGECANCRNGVSTSCLVGGWWGGGDGTASSADGCQGERVHVPLADGTLVVVPGTPDDALVPHLLTLADVLGTGWHAAVSGGVRPGSTVAVVGDGAVGLCAVLASRLLGAERIVAMSRHESRAALAREFGATDVLAERGQAAVDALHEMFDGIGPDVVLECVGTQESMDTALRAARPGGQVGFVGVPAGGPELPVGTMFASNVGVRGGVAPVREYIEPLLARVLAGEISPGRVFDLELGLDQVGEAYAAMDERRAIKVLLRP